MPWTFDSRILQDDENVSRLQGVRTLVHAVFFAHRPHGHVYARISPCVPLQKAAAGVLGAPFDCPVVPHIVRRAERDGPDLRRELGIPEGATVFGRHGGWETFDIPFAREAIVFVARSRPQIFFLLMNSPPIWDPLPNIIHLAKTSDPSRKAAFIRTCDAMVHARQGGESFGLAIAEFSAMGRPILTSSIHHDHHQADFHLTTLCATRGCDRFFYNDRESLVKLLVGFDREDVRRHDYNAYRQFEPAVVMRTFQQIFLSPSRLPTQHITAEESADAMAEGMYSSAEGLTSLSPVEEPDVKRLEALARLEKLDQEMRSLVRLPEEPERSLGHDTTNLQPIRFRCVFKPYVFSRLAPTTCAAAMAQIHAGDIVYAVGIRGSWVRLVVPPRPSDGHPLERWVLTWHPLHGQLLEALDFPPDALAHVDRSTVDASADGGWVTAGTVYRPSFQQQHDRGRAEPCAERNGLS